MVLHVCLSRSESERTETAIQTDSPSQRTGADTTRSLGPTTLLRDTAIRAEDAAGTKESPKTAVLLALSRPSRPISRSQSQVTVAGEGEELTMLHVSCLNRRMELQKPAVVFKLQRSSRRKRRSRRQRTPRRAPCSAPRPLSTCYSRGGAGRTLPGAALNLHPETKLARVAASTSFIPVPP